MDIFHIILISIISALLFYKAKNKAVYMDKLKQKDQAFEELYDYCFQNAKFPDSDGKSDMPYKSNEVSEMWEKFHELGWNYYGRKK